MSTSDFFFPSIHTTQDDDLDSKLALSLKEQVLRAYDEARKPFPQGTELSAEMRRNRLISLAIMSLPQFAEAAAESAAAAPATAASSSKKAVKS